MQTKKGSVYWIINREFNTKWKHVRTRKFTISKKFIEVKKEHELLRFIGKATLGNIEGIYVSNTEQNVKSFSEKK